MGWGAKKGAAAPQPKEELPALDYDGPELSHEAATALRAKYAPVNEPPEKPTDAVKAQLAWHQLKSRKGWTAETLVLLFYEFVQSQGAFPQLLEFAKKRR